MSIDRDHALFKDLSRLSHLPVPMYTDRAFPICLCSVAMVLDAQPCRKTVQISFNDSQQKSEFHRRVLPAHCPPPQL